MKKIIIILFVLVLVMQTGCNGDKDIKYFIKQLNKDGETVDIVKEYKSYNISQKQIFNYFYNDIYRHYDYMCFNEALEDSKKCYEPFELYTNTLMYIKGTYMINLKLYTSSGSNNIDKMVYTNLYVPIIGSSEGYEEYCNYTEEQISQRDNIYRRYK